MATASPLKNTRLSVASPSRKVVASSGGSLGRTGLAGPSSKLRCAERTSLQHPSPTKTAYKGCALICSSTLLVGSFRQGKRTDFCGAPGVAVLSCKRTRFHQRHVESDACKKAFQRPVATASVSQEERLGRAKASDAETLIDGQEELENSQKAASANDFTDKKLCTECGVQKPLRNFGKLVSSADGRHLLCRACLAKRRAQEKGIELYHLAMPVAEAWEQARECLRCKQVQEVPNIEALALLQRPGSSADVTLALWQAAPRYSTLLHGPLQTHTELIRVDGRSPKSKRLVASDSERTEGLCGGVSWLAVRNSDVYRPTSWSVQLRCADQGGT
ncbi:hypothetical protein KFL_001310090 [Klebsormidium nitens]|uniref:Stc1 domain-containing protein n=1 Tax=Klebsormidium nitens TaxID=105231 RepID=A0A1Y1I4E2_KLENI|nr:hypothetical protein KFL_001310090 [Klebsormidium nitens]|eukprot:GAQ82978.1 hypothetical protein KFL_001310090 [Klebsormidium nitens]